MTIQDWFKLAALRLILILFRYCSHDSPSDCLGMPRARDHVRHSLAKYLHGMTFTAAGSGVQTSWPHSGSMLAQLGRIRGPKKWQEGYSEHLGLILASS